MMEFYVLDDLICDILLGEEFLDQISAFETYQNSFASAGNSDCPPEVNVIRWYNRMEMRINRLIGNGSDQATSQAPNGI